MYERPSVSVLLGKTLTSVVNNDNTSLVFTDTDGTVYSLHHEQDCCESVMIEDIDNDLDVLVGSPIIMAEEVTNMPEPEQSPPQFAESYTWTFYKFATVKGYVTVRWFGTSNGWYSESVDFHLYQ